MGYRSWLLSETHSPEFYRFDTEYEWVEVLDIATEKGSPENESIETSARGQRSRGKIRNITCSRSARQADLIAALIIGVLALLIAGGMTYLTGGRIR